MIKIIDSLYLTEKGCSIKKRNYHPVHIRQGDIDGACAVYSLIQNLFHLLLEKVRKSRGEKKISGKIKYILHYRAGFEI